jgi:hypothetical protein
MAQKEKVAERLCGSFCSHPLMQRGCSPLSKDVFALRVAATGCFHFMEVSFLSLKNLKKAPYEVKAASAIRGFIIIILPALSPQMAHLLLNH